MDTITETLNALDEVKKAIQEAYASGYSNGKQRTWVGLTKNEVEQTLIDHNMGALPHRIECIRAIEAKLKEQNT